MFLFLLIQGNSKKCSSIAASPVEGRRTGTRREETAGKYLCNIDSGWFQLCDSLGRPEFSVFTTRCTIVQTAKRGLAIACHPSVCPSVTLVDCAHIGWKSWKLIARTIISNTFALRSPKAIHLLPGNIVKFWGDQTTDEPTYHYRPWKNYSIVVKISGEKKLYPS